MKKILASVATFAAVVTGFATSVYAAGTNSGTGGSSAAADFNSVHTGSVSPTCSLDVTDGALPTASGLVSSLTTPAASKGKISTVCNSTTSTLAVTVETPGTSNLAAAAIGGYSETFELTGGTGAYSSGLTTGFGTTYNKTDLSNNYSSGASTVDVTAKVAVASANILPSGNYTVKVKATVTP